MCLAYAKACSPQVHLHGNASCRALLNTVRIIRILFLNRETCFKHTKPVLPLPAGNNSKDKNGDEPIGEDDILQKEVGLSSYDNI